MASTQRRIMSAYLFLVFFPILFAGSLFYTTAAAVFRSAADAQASRTLQATDLALRTALREIDVVSDLAICSDSVQTLLTTGDSDAGADFLAKEAMKRDAVAVLSGNVRILGAALYGRRGLLLQFGAGDAPPYREFIEQTAYARAVLAAGRPVWLGPAENGSLFAPTADRRICFSQVRLVKDFYTLEDIGVLVLQLDPELIESIFFELFAGVDDGVFLLNANKLVLFGNDAALIGQRLPVFDAVGDAPEGSFLSRWNDRPVLASYLRSKTGWILVSLASLERLEKTGQLFRNAAALLFLPVLGFAFFFNFYFMRRFTSFVDVLSRTMHRLRGGELSVRLAPVRGPEYSLLRDDFNSMAERLERQVADIQREQAVKRDAEFRLLQAQIKPHFLYNTLESINALASLRGDQEIMKITTNLGKLLRLSIAKDDFLTVSDEIAQVRAYLEIQKVRYRRRFEYEIDVDPRLAKYRIIKLILQPVVENAIYHGFESYESGGKIRVSGRTVAGFPQRACLTIEDNGAGVPDAVLAALAREAVRTDGLGPPAASPDDGSAAAVGHGIVSVYRRLKIGYGAEGALFIGRGESGTTVKIVFPLREA
jgi:two-component system sensor histidine kinase YesM